MLHPRPCRYCGAPLTALQQHLGDLCDAAPCRRRAGDDLTAAQRQSAWQAWRSAALQAGADARLQHAPVFWLRDHDTTPEPVSAAERDAQRAHLEAAAAEAAHAPATTFDDEIPPPGPADDGIVCGHCRGRCCREGAGERHGFVDAALLQRWQRRHGGTLADAAADYAARVPAWHASGSCIYHGVQGCTLRRDDRSDICNGYTCQPLRDTRAPLAGDVQRGVVLARAARSRLVDAAWLHGPRPLQLELLTAPPGAGDAATPPPAAAATP